MKYVLSIFFVFSGITTLVAQTRDAQLRQQLFEVVEKYISNSDLSQQNSSDAKSEQFNTKIADDFVELFKENIESLQIPNIYSEELIAMYDTTFGKQGKVDESNLYISVNDYYMLSRGNQTLKAFTFSPSDQPDPVVILYKHEKKVKGNQFQSVLGVEYNVQVSKGDKLYNYTLPVTITCVYQLDESGVNYTYPKIEKVAVGVGSSGGKSIDFYITPFVDASVGNMNFEENRISEFETTSNGNLGFGVLVQLKKTNSFQKLSKSVILGIGYRQIKYTHELNDLTLVENNLVPPFEPLEGMVSNYSKESVFRNIEEQSKLSMIIVPVGLGLDLRIGGLSSDRSVFLNPTVVFGFPINYKSNYSSGTIDYIGHYTIAGPGQSFPIIIDDYYGYGKDFPVKAVAGNYSLNKLNVMGELEFGYKLQFNQSSSIKVGCFLNHSFSNVFSNSTDKLIQISEWNGEMKSYPYFTNPIKNTLVGIRISIENFGFQWKRTIDSIEKI